jgi:hypothetical protein
LLEKQLRRYCVISAEKPICGKVSCTLVSFCNIQSLNKGTKPACRIWREHFLENRHFGRWKGGKNVHNFFYIRMSMRKCRIKSLIIHSNVQGLFPTFSPTVRDYLAPRLYCFDVYPLMQFLVVGLNRREVLNSHNLIYSVFWVIKRRRVISIIQAFQDYHSHLQGSSRPLNMRPIDRTETSVSNHLTPRTKPEDGRIYFNSGRSLR